MPQRTASRAPRRGLGDLEVLLTRIRAGGLEVSVERNQSGRAHALPPLVDEAAYTVVQESLTNVLRHARASRAVVSIVEDQDTLVLTITDDGQGGHLPPAELPGMGITGMRSRAEGLGGHLEAGPTRSGFRVQTRLPR